MIDRLPAVKSNLAGTLSGGTYNLNMSEVLCGFLTCEHIKIKRTQEPILFLTQSMLCKMLDGKARGDLDLFTPQFGEPLTLSKKRTRGDFQEGIQLKSLVRASSLDSFKRSFLGRAPAIWKQLPVELRDLGRRTSFTSIKKQAKLFQVVIRHTGMRSHQLRFNGVAE